MYSLNYFLSNAWIKESCVNVLKKTELRSGSGAQQVNKGNTVFIISCRPKHRLKNLTWPFITPYGSEPLSEVTHNGLPGVWSCEQEYMFVYIRCMGVSHKGSMCFCSSVWKCVWTDRPLRLNWTTPLSHLARTPRLLPKKLPSLRNGMWQTENLFTFPWPAATGIQTCAV